MEVAQFWIHWHVFFLSLLLEKGCPIEQLTEAEASEYAAPPTLALGSVTIGQCDGHQPPWAHGQYDRHAPSTMRREPSFVQAFSVGCNLADCVGKAVFVLVKTLSKPPRAGCRTRIAGR